MTTFWVMEKKVFWITVWHFIKMEMYNNDLIMCLFKTYVYSIFFASVVSLYPLFRVLNFFVMLYNIFCFLKAVVLCRRLKEWYFHLFIDWRFHNLFNELLFIFPLQRRKCDRFNYEIETFTIESLPQWVTSFDLWMCILTVKSVA